MTEHEILLADYIANGGTVEEFDHDFGEVELEDEGDPMGDVDSWCEHRHTAAQYGVGRFA